MTTCFGRQLRLSNDSVSFIQKGVSFFYRQIKEYTIFHCVVLIGESIIIIDYKQNFVAFIPLTPNDLYMSYRTANLQTLYFIYLFKQI